MLSIEEAWNLPISAEMSSRQQQQQNTTQTTRSTSSNSQSSSSYQKSLSSGQGIITQAGLTTAITTTTTTPQGPPPPYPSPSGGPPTKQFKSENIDQKIVVSSPQSSPQSFNLTHQQLQLLSYFQQNINTITPAQQVSIW